VREMITNVKCPLFLSDFNGTLNFLDRFSKNAQISNFIKIRPVTAELFHASVTLVPPVFHPSPCLNITFCQKDRRGKSAN